MTKITVRLDDDLHAALTITAGNNRRSLNSEMLRAFEYYLKNSPEAQYDPDELEKTKKPASE